MKKKRERILALDGLRGYSALIVVAFHVLTWSPAFNAAHYEAFYENQLLEVLTVTPLKFFWAGNEAIVLFFMIGGMVITMPYINGKKFEYWKFIGRRFVTIIFPYLIAVTLTLIGSYYYRDLTQDVRLAGTFNTKWSRFPTTSELWNTYLLMDNHLNIIAGVFWSIIQEWRISFIIPIVGYWFSKEKNKKSMAIALLSWALVWAGLGYLMVVTKDTTFYPFVESFERTAYYSIYFMIGSALAVYYESLSGWVKSHKLVTWFLPLSIIIITNRWWLRLFGIMLGQRPALLIAAIGYVMLLISVIEIPDLHAFFSNRPAILLGNVSFGIYLTHTTMIILVVSFLGQVIEPVYALIVSTFLVIPTAFLFTRFVVAPCAKLARSLLFLKRPA